VGRFSGRDGVELAYREVGEGRPLVLVHGITASGSQWLDPGPARAFAELGRRVILPDLRGHGDSAKPHDPAAYPPDVLADDGLTMVEQLGLDDYDLGGYSLGARVVLRMLVRGARPARAIVAGQGLKVVSSPLEPDNRNRRLFTAMIEGERFEPGSPEAQQAHWINQLGGDPRALLLVLESHVPTPEADLARITVPTLVAVGDRDERHASADALAALLPDARFVRVPGDHYTASTSPELASAITAFLTS
jgi:pimeloyl-ACP methyl ester carboxylesterase